MLGFTLATVLQSPLIALISAAVGCLAIVSLVKFIRSVADDILSNEWGD